MQKVAITDTTGKIPFAVLQSATAAFQKQVTEHLAPVWLLEPTVIKAYQYQSEIPSDEWQVLIKESLSIDVYGYHAVDNTGKPFAVLKYVENWTHVASHELMEMLVDPYGDRVLSGEIFAQSEGEENILVEVADPSQNVTFGYMLDGIMVSDFYFPSYFEPYKIAGKQYSFTRAIQEPRSIVIGGYVSFKDRIGDWWQAFNIDNEIVYRKLSSGEELTTSQKGRLERGIAISLFLLGAISFAIGIILRLKKQRNND